MCAATAVDEFIERVTAVGGTVTRVSPAEVVEGLRALVVADGLVLVTPELHTLAGDLREAGVDARVAARDALAAACDGRSLEEVLRAAGAGVTGAVVAVASSGSVAVGAGGGNGGLLAALPPHHVIILPEALIVPSLADAMRVIGSRFEDLGGEVVFVTGPSRTADIEMMSVVGVHGPLRLDVLLIAGPWGAAAEPDADRRSDAEGGLSHG